jgi:hypothetical protein
VRKSGLAECTKVAARKKTLYRAVACFSSFCFAYFPLISFPELAFQEVGIHAHSNRRAVLGV